MRSDIVTAIQEKLTAAGDFSMVCGLHSDKPAYPLARVWYQGARENLDNEPQARLNSNIGVQIETVLEKDENGNSVDGPLYDLVDTAFNALHNYKLPGAGSQNLWVYDAPGLSGFKADDGPSIYLLTVTARVIPESFSLT